MNTPAPYKFFAFISYRHTDIKAAKKLQRLLEHYNLPTSIQKQVRGDVPKRIKVFRDTDELTSGVLGDELRKKLDESKFLVVLCSPNSAKSKYCGDEIAYFRTTGRQDRIIPFIIDGIPHCPDKDKDCFNPELTKGGLEILGIDVNAHEGFCYSWKFHKAFIRLVAKMFDLDYGVLWNRRKHFIIKSLTSLFLLIVALITLIIYIVFATKSFDSTIRLNEAGTKTALMLSDDGRDSLFLYLDGDNIRRHKIQNLNTDIQIKDIPGHYRNKTVRLVVSAYGCIPLDTTISIRGEQTIDVARNIETFGRIKCYVVDSDFLTPVSGALFDFGFATALTDEQGLLDILIPFEYQQTEKYKVKITLNGMERYIFGQSELDPNGDRPDIPRISLMPN